MSFPKKLVTTYAKSLFLNVKNSSPLEEKRVFFDVTNVSSYLSKAKSVNLFLMFILSERN